MALDICLYERQVQMIRLRHHPLEQGQLFSSCNGATVRRFDAAPIADAGTRSHHDPKERLLSRQQRQPLLGCPLRQIGIPDGKRSFIDPVRSIHQCGLDHGEDEAVIAEPAAVPARCVDTGRTVDQPAEARIWTSSGRSIPPRE